MRRVDVFFYGLFMDQDLLRSKGLLPESAERATVADMALRLGERATLVPASGGRVHGVICSLTSAELDRLYSEPSVEAYAPQAVLAHVESGGLVTALCYVLLNPPAAIERNAEYTAKLRTVARKLGLPSEYVESI